MGQRKKRRFTLAEIKAKEAPFSLATPTNLGPGTVTCVICWFSTTHNVTNRARSRGSCCLSTTRGPGVPWAYTLCCFLNGILKTFPDMDASMTSEWYYQTCRDSLCCACSVVLCCAVLLCCVQQKVSPLCWNAAPASLDYALGCCGERKWRCVFMQMRRTMQEGQAIT